MACRAAVFWQLSIVQHILHLLQLHACCNLAMFACRLCTQEQLIHSSDLVLLMVRLAPETGEASEGKHDQANMENGKQHSYRWVQVQLQSANQLQSKGFTRLHPHQLWQRSRACQVSF